MSDKLWTMRSGDPTGAVQGGQSDGYKAWRSNSGSMVRDLKFVPAAGSGELVRFEPYAQAITLELREDENELCLMGHTTGQIIFISGRGLGELAEQISAKRVQSVHVWSEADGSAPECVVTALRFDKSISDLAT